MQLKKPSGEQLRRWLSYSLMILILALCAYTCSPRRGFWSTLPLMTLGSFVSALFCYTPKYAVLLSALCGLTFSVGDASSLPFGALVAAFCALAAWLSSLSVKHFAGFFSAKKASSLLLALLLLVPAPLVQTVIFGTPWENLRMQRHFEEYVREKYPEQSFLEIRSYYDLAAGDPCALLRFAPSADTVLEATLSYEDGAVKEDGFFTLFCQKGLEEKQSRFVKLLRERYPEPPLWLDCSKTTVKVEDTSSFSGSYGDLPSWLDSTAAVELGFRFSIPDAATFLATVKEYYGYLLDAGFSFGQLRFYGGDQGTYRYTLCVTPDTSPDELASLLKHCKISMNISSVSLEYSYLF